MRGEKYEEIKRSIEVNGIRDPIKCDMNYTVISGHQRLRIARDLGIEEVPVQIIDVDEQIAEYLLIAENVERRGQAETDPIKKSRIANFLKEYWGVQHGMNRHTMSGQNGQSKTTADIAEALGESEKSTRRILKLNDLIPELQQLVSSKQLGTTAAEQLAYLSKDEQKALVKNNKEEISNMTVAESKKLRKEIETLRKELEEEKNKPPKVETKVVKEVAEVIPEHVTKELQKMRAQQEAEEKAKRKLQEMIGKLEDEKTNLENILKSDEYKLKQKKEKEEALRSEAHISMFEAQIIIQKFIEEFAPTIYLQGAMAYADRNVRKEMMESVKALEKCVENLKDMLQAEKIKG
ncbi:ParB N-terminal domain-containing protein [Siminovitchia sp. 179-K 8D1 HS]|uniref:ParB N-terminal domain-containing protein n=1 Tax=Siminovitchia sp. 179-K 8D1 HS TaxID=3142385 RepID=UPI0039A09300